MKILEEVKWTAIHERDNGRHMNYEHFDLWYHIVNLPVGCKRSRAGQWWVIFDKAWQLMPEVRNEEEAKALAVAFYRMSNN